MEKLSEKKSKWQMGVSSTLLWKSVLAFGVRGVSTSRACPAIAIQIAATNAISIGFGQQVGAVGCLSGKRKERVSPSTSWCPW